MFELQSMTDEEMDAIEEKVANQSTVDSFVMLPCPFCGGNVSIGLNFGRFGIGCDDCQANMRATEVCADESEEQALIRMWNTRAT